jgi:hypothetical protein
LSARQTILLSATATKQVSWVRSLIIPHIGSIDTHYVSFCVMAFFMIRMRSGIRC